MSRRRGSRRSSSWRLTATLENLRTLDLFADHDLDWRPLAEIAIADSFAANLATIAPRYEISPTMSQARLATTRRPRTTTARPPRPLRPNRAT